VCIDESRKDVSALRVDRSIRLKLKVSANCSYFSVFNGNIAGE
jgi:hypothetical protein